MDWVYIMMNKSGSTLYTLLFLGRNGDNHQKYNRIRVKIQEQGSSHLSYRETLKISIRTRISDMISIEGREIILYIRQIIENKVA